LNRYATENDINKTRPRLRPTGSLAQAGALSRGTLRRILEVHLPSEPYRYPRLPQAAKTLQAMSGDSSAGQFVKSTADCPLFDNDERIVKFGKVVTFFDFSAGGQSFVDF